MDGVQRVPYRLPELIEADASKPVFVVEGEKDADRMADEGFIATCNVGGAGKWKDEYNQHLEGRCVVILPDNDDPGQHHAEQVATSLHSVAASVKVLNLPGLPDKGDVSDWFDKGGTAAKLKALVKATGEWSPPRKKPPKPLKTVNGHAIPDGSRNAMLTSMAGAMRRKGSTEEAIYAALKEDNAKRCIPPLAESELRGIAQSVVKYEPSDPQLNSLTSLNSHDIPQLPDAAYHGLVGDILHTLDPYTEASPAAVLAHLLVGVGIIAGSAPHFLVQHDRHCPRVNALLVGKTSKGRKGTSWGSIKHLFKLAVPDWLDSQVVSGLSSGEGLINRVRDRDIDDEDEDDDKPAVDKRLMVIEPEFANVLIQANRDRNTLSCVIRQAFDDGELSVLTRNDPLTASNAHIGIIGHITQEELHRQLNQTQMANGFANRFLYFLVERSKTLPDGATPPDAEMVRLATALKKMLTYSFPRQFKRDEDATRLWHNVYEALSEGKPGLTGAVLSRAEVLVLRLSLIYALVDRSKTIGKQHLEAALGIWGYCDQSATAIFGESTGDDLADRIYRLLEEGPKTQTDLHHQLGNHESSESIKSALKLLEGMNRITATKKKTKGRSAFLWSCVAKEAK
jgi:hypothetical protein